MNERTDLNGLSARLLKVCMQTGEVPVEQAKQELHSRNVLLNRPNQDKIAGVRVVATENANEQLNNNND